MTVDDADVLGRLHMSAWQTAYRGIMSDEFLDALDPSQSAERWRNNMALRRPDIRNVVAVDDDDDVRGFCTTGKVRTEESNDTSLELYAIYVWPDEIGTSIGRLMMQDALDHARRSGFDEMVLWVLTENARSRRFYEAAGFEVDARVDPKEFRDTGAYETRYRQILSAPFNARPRSHAPPTVARAPAPDARPETGPATSPSPGRRS